MLLASSSTSSGKTATFPNNTGTVAEINSGTSGNLAQLGSPLGVLVDSTIAASNVATLAGPNSFVGNNLFNSTSGSVNVVNNLNGGIALVPAGTAVVTLTSTATAARSAALIDNTGKIAEINSGTAGNLTQISSPLGLLADSGIVASNVATQSGNNTFSGTNTHSGVESYTNSLNVTFLNQGASSSPAATTDVQWFGTVASGQGYSFQRYFGTTTSASPLVLLTVPMLTGAAWCAEYKVTGYCSAGTDAGLGGASYGSFAVVNPAGTVTAYGLANGSATCDFFGGTGVFGSVDPVTVGAGSGAFSFSVTGSAASTYKWSIYLFLYMN